MPATGVRSHVDMAMSMCNECNVVVEAAGLEPMHGDVMSSDAQVTQSAFFLAHM